MSLINQIQSIALSFLFGMFFCLIYNLSYFILYTKSLLLNLITNIMFSLIMFGIYFLLLYNINCGMIHTYFIIVLFISFYLYNKLFVKLRVKWKKRELK